MVGSINLWHGLEKQADGGRTLPFDRSRAFQNVCTSLFQSLMLAKAKEQWEQEQEDKQGEKQRYLAERVASLHTSGLSFAQLQVSWGTQQLFDNI